MKRHLLKPLLLILWAWLVFASMPAQSAVPGDLGFGLRVAGTFLAQLEVTGSNGTLFTVQALASLSADGVATATDTDDFGFGTTAGFQSPKHGAWKRTGARAISMTLLEFAYDSTGNLTTIYKLVFDIEFSDQQLDTATGHVRIDTFLLNQNPLDPNEKPVASGTGTLSAQRIKA